MWPNDFGDRGGEGDDIVFNLGFDLKDAVDVEICALAIALAASLGTNTGFCQSFRGRDFDGKPCAEAVFRHSRCGPFPARV